MKKLFLCWFALSLAGAADVLYTKKVSYAAEGLEEGQMSIRTTVAFKGKRERTDTTSSFGPIKMRTVSMVLCDLEQDVRVEPDLKIYTASRIQPGFVTQAPDPTGSDKKPEPPQEKPGTGKMTMTFKVQALGNEKILGIDTRHYKVRMDMVTEGCCGNQNTTLEREVWVSNKRPRFSCPLRDGRSDYVQNGCKVTVVRKGDVALYDESNQGEPLKEIIYQNGKPMMTTEVVEYSEAALPDSMFSLEGMRKVSESEFNQASQDKMMKDMTP